MVLGSADEVMFTVVGAQAHLSEHIGIEDLGLTEPAHLEKWIIAYPQALGPGVMIIASQYDRWISPSGIESHDRLDLLGLGNDGRLVVAELKRGRAPETVELQAIKYTAMSSRFTLDQLADLHADFLERTGQDKLTASEATEKLQAHALNADLSVDGAFLRPRIVLLAESFPSPVTTSVVWLSENGISITMRRYQAYRTVGDETVLSVSQVYPPPEVDIVVPAGGVRSPQPPNLPEIPWSADDFATLISLAFPVPNAVLTVCSGHPGDWVSVDTIYQRAGVAIRSGAGQLAGFGYSVRTRFGRSNSPWETRWRAGGENVRYYRVDPDTATAWLDALGRSDEDQAVSTKLNPTQQPYE